MIVQMDTVGREKPVALNLALHTAAFDGNPSNRWNGQSRARKPHAHCITRVTNASGIEFRKNNGETNSAGK